MYKKQKKSVVNTNSDKLNIGADAEVVHDSVLGKKRRPYNYMIVIFALMVLVVIFIVGFAFSWFQPGQEADLSVAATDFDVIADYSISGSGYAPLTDDVELSISDLSTLKLRMKYSGYSSAYIKVQLFASFKNADDKLITVSDINYALTSNWKEKDGIYYHKTPVMQAQSGDEPKLIEFCSGAVLPSDVTYPEGSYVTLVAIAEAVQPDRFEDFFGFNPDRYLPSDVLYSTGAAYKKLDKTTRFTAGDDLSLKIEYTGVYNAYIRVSVPEMITSSSINNSFSEDLNYTLADNWVEYDGYLYYRLEVPTHIVRTTTADDGTVSTTKVKTEIPFFDSITTADGYSGSYGLSFEVEAVQEEDFESVYGVSYSIFEG